MSTQVTEQGERNLLCELIPKPAKKISVRNFRAFRQGISWVDIANTFQFVARGGNCVRADAIGGGQLNRQRLNLGHLA